MIAHLIVQAVTHPAHTAAVALHLPDAVWGLLAAAVVGGSAVSARTLFGDVQALLVDEDLTGE